MLVIEMKLFSVFHVTGKTEMLSQETVNLNLINLALMEKVLNSQKS